MTMTKTETRLPSVIGIGSRRCGSSMLHDALNEHPEIGKPPRGLHYFSEHADKGVQWYQRQLQPHARRKVTLEYSISYAYPEYCEAAAERILQAIPDARLFLTVRNPVARAFSDYLRSTRMCEIPSDRSFETAIERHPHLLERGLYYRVLEPYLERFPRQRVKVLFLEDLLNSPDAYWDELLQFIGVDEQFRPGDGVKPIGRRSVRWAGVNRAVFATKSVCDAAANRLHMNCAWYGLKRMGRGSYRRLFAWNTVSADMTPDVRDRLRDYYRDDVAKLARLTGRTLNHWK